MTQHPDRTQHASGGLLKSLAVGFCVYAFASALAAWLTLHNIHGFLASMDNILSGLACGLIVLLYERWRQRDIQKKMRTIQLMNHHVRNALQIISAASDCLDGTAPPSTLQAAVRRIEWALREVLPGENGVTDSPRATKPGTPLKDPLHKWHSPEPLISETGDTQPCAVSSPEE